MAAGERLSRHERRSTGRGRVGRGQGIRRLPGDGVGEVAARLNDVRQDRQGEALLVLQLSELLLVVVGAAHVLQHGEEAPDEEERDGHRDHQLDQGESALAVTGAHGSTYTM